MLLTIRKNKNKFISEQKERFHDFYKYLNNFWKPILWVLPLSHRLPKQQHCSEIINTKIHWPKKEIKSNLVNAIQIVNLQITKTNTLAVPKFDMNVLIIYQLDIRSTLKKDIILNKTYRALYSQINVL